jgi:hypothetical protein
MESSLALIMKILIHFTIIFTCVAIARAEDYSQYFSISVKDEIETKHQLELYERGKLTRQDLNEKSNEEGWRRLIGYYLLHTNDMPIKDKLLIGRTYAGFAPVSRSYKA